jgi:hypothetical protein
MVAADHFPPRIFTGYKKGIATDANADRASCSVARLLDKLGHTDG